MRSSGSPDLADTVLLEHVQRSRARRRKDIQPIDRLQDRIKSKRPEPYHRCHGLYGSEDEKIILEQSPVRGSNCCVRRNRGRLPRIAGQSSRRRWTANGGRSQSKSGFAGNHPALAQKLDPLRESLNAAAPSQAYLRIQIGCDKFCYVLRCPKHSRSRAGSIAGANHCRSRRFWLSRCKEVTLLRQTVDSYQYVDDSGVTTRLSDLLHQLHDVDGIERLEFSHQLPEGYDGRASGRGS